MLGLQGSLSNTVPHGLFYIYPTVPRCTTVPSALIYRYSTVPTIITPASINTRRATVLTVACRLAVQGSQYTTVLSRIIYN